MTDLRLSDNQGMATDLKGDGSPLLVTFGGVATQPGAPMFEFFKITADGLPGQRVFLRDHGRGWYHHGVWGVADSIPGVHAWLHDRIRESRASRVVFIGNSAGGYAALLFGGMLHDLVDEVHAFAPQSFLTPALRRRYRDDRWADQIGNVPPDSPYGDLKGLALPGRAHVHFSVLDRLDTAHALRLRGRVTLHAYQSVEAHSLVKDLRADGRLRQLIERSLTTGGANGWRGDVRVPRTVARPAVLARRARAYAARRRAVR
jgi:hypothetical protein